MYPIVGAQQQMVRSHKVAGQSLPKIAHEECLYLSSTLFMLKIVRSVAPHQWSTKYLCISTTTKSILDPI
jgi:hypothetical protein